MAQKDILRHSD